MVKFKQVGTLDVSKINPVLKSEKDVMNNSFQVIDEVPYVIMNTLTGDDAYKDAVIIKAGEYLNGYAIDAICGHTLVVDAKHIKGTFDEIEGGTFLKIGTEGQLEVSESAPEDATYFVVTSLCKLTEDAVEVLICSAGSKIDATKFIEQKNRATIPAKEKSWSDIPGKTAEDLIGEDAEIAWNGVTGSVTGTLKHITGWTQFSPKESDGHFFPISLNKKYMGKTLKVSGKEPKTVTVEGDTELDWVLRVDDTKVFTFECDGETILALDFNGATLQE